MKIKPLFDRILVKQIDEKNETKSGILLPTSSQEKPIVAKVVAAGCGGKIDGDDVEICVKVGDKVLFNKFASSELEFEGEKFLILRQADILAVLEN